MHRNNLLAQLNIYRAENEEEEQYKLRTIKFVKTTSDCFERSNLPGHITGSAWLLDRTGNRVLLTHHRKLNRWLQLGGHADGNPDVLQVALQEAREESGIINIAPVSENIFDVDVHLIPARKNVLEHLHYDIRYLFRVTDSEEYKISHESIDLKWVSQDEFSQIQVDQSVQRLYEKWIHFRDPKTQHPVPDRGISIANAIPN